MASRSITFRLPEDTLGQLAGLAASNGGVLTAALKEAAAQFRLLVEEAGKLNAEAFQPDDWVRLGHLNDPDPFGGVDVMPAGRHGVDWSAALAAELIGMWEGRDTSLPTYRQEASACRELARRVAALGRLRGYALMASLRYFWRSPEAGIDSCRSPEVWLSTLRRRCGEIGVVAS